jgi:hypothetical protein
MRRGTQELPEEAASQLDLNDRLGSDRAEVVGGQDEEQVKAVDAEDMAALGDSGGNGPATQIGQTESFEQTQKRRSHQTPVSRNRQWLNRTLLRSDSAAR